ncbi:MAG: carbohydrate ABC transporter permease [bacterium]
MTAAQEPAASGLWAESLRRWLFHHRLEMLMVLPLITYLFLLTLAPIVHTFGVSLTEPGHGEFPSLANFRDLFDSPVFHSAVENTIVVAIVSLALELVVGLGIALALHARFPLRDLARTVILVPLGIPTIVSGAIMILIFSRSGYLNSLLFALSEALNKMPGIDWEFRPLSWTVAGGWRTLLTVAVADTWKVLPVVSLIFLAGLQEMSEDIREAAEIDGATRWQHFSRITLPLLLPYVTIALILRAIDAFRIFELSLVLSGRVEPVIGTYIWSRYGPPISDPFTAAAASIVLYTMIMAFIVAYSG